MKKLCLLLLCASMQCAASAQTKRSSRNLEPLTKRPDSAPAATPNGNSGMPAAPATAPAKETVSKITFVGPKSGWGFVQTKSPYYSPQGKNLGTLAGGTLFKYEDVRDSSKNSVLLSTVKRGNGWEGPYLLDCTDVVAYDGSPDTVDPETFKKLADYFTLKGKIAERREALSEEALAANPHFESSRQAQQEYQDSISKAAEMEQQLKTLSGSRKTKADEALRALKYEQVRIKTKADQETAAYQAWKAAHPADPSKLANDPQLKALEAELRAAAATLSDLIPPAS